MQPPPCDSRLSVTAAPPTEPESALPAGELDWLAPARVYCSDRHGGVSGGAWASNNLGHHVNDAPDAVTRNRSKLLDLPDLTAVQWLNQIHSTEVLQVRAPGSAMPSVDAVWTDQPGVGLAILTADCLPVVLADVDGQVVGAAHAGWRGLCAGVLPALIAAMPVPRERLRAFIGPAIGPGAFEVGEEVVAALAAAKLEGCAVETPGKTGKWQVDLVSACRSQLTAIGLGRAVGGDWCTYADQRFYSWRRATHVAQQAGRSPVTGRQATLIWLP